MSSTVTVGGMEITSNHESADAMVEALTPKDGDKTPRVVVRDGQPAEDEQKAAVSKAAAELGKRGGEAAAKARAEKAKAAEAEAEPEKAAEPEGETDEPAGKARRHDAATRIQQLARERQEATRRAEAAEAERRELSERLARIEAQMAGKPAPKPASEPQEAAQGDPADPEPQEDQYDSYRDYVKAQARWEARQEFRAVQKQEQERARQQAQAQGIAKHLQSFEQRVQKAAETDPEVAEGLLGITPTFGAQPGETLTVHHAIADEYLASEHAPEVMRYLLDNPEEKARLEAARSVREVARLFGIFEDRATARKPAAEPRRASAAPPPLRPVTPSASGGGPDITGELDFDTFAARRRSAR